MKLFFIARVDLVDTASGISRKVFSQHKAMAGEADAYLLGYYGKELVLYHNGEIDRIIPVKMHRGVQISTEAVALAKELKIDCTYIRRFDCEPTAFAMLKKLKAINNMPILWEIPTYPYDYEKIYSFDQIFRRQIDKIYRKRLGKYVDRIVTFSNEKVIFGVPTINTGNGLDVAEVRERRVLSENRDIHMIAAAVLRNWHGYDRLFNGMAAYYANGGNRNIVFHLVGDGPCLEEYRELVNKWNLEERVIFYGFLEKAQIDEVYDKCNLAVESLGWHRSKVSVGTSLKTREYVAKGLPILASTEMDIFPGGWEYAYYAPIDDSPIEIDQVVTFFDGIYDGTDPNELAFKIRKIAFERCDMKAMMKPVINYFLEVI